MSWTISLEDDIESTIQPLQTYKYLQEVANIDPEVPSSDLNEQEQQLIDDVLTILSGGEGHFIQFDVSFDPSLSDDRINGPKYRIDPRIHVGFKDLIVSINLIASCAYSVRVFAEIYSSLEYGSVLNAFACSFRNLYKQFLIFLAPLDHQIRESGTGSTKLLNVYTFLLPFRAYLLKSKVLITAFLNAFNPENRIAMDKSDIASSAESNKLALALNMSYYSMNEFKGGSVLRLTSEVLRDALGDSDAVYLYQELLTAGSQPYLKMLIYWLTEGVLIDPYDEFLIQKSSGFYVDNVGTQFREFWNRRFSLRNSVPPMAFNNKEIRHKVLEAGKYINVIIRTLGNDCTALKYDPEILRQLNSLTSIEDPQLLVCVEKAYDFANTELLKLLKTHKYSVKEFVRVLKDLYFFGETQTLNKFLDLAKQDLQKPVSEVELGSLQKSLSVVLNPENMWSQFISVSLAQDPLKESLTDLLLYSQSAGSRTDEGIGFNFVQVDFTPPFPLSIFVSKRTIQRYQYLSRFLMEVNRSYQIMQDLWIIRLQDPAFVCFDNNDALHEDVIRRASLLHDRMTRFIAFLNTHITESGIMVHWDQFCAKLETETTVTQLEYDHNLYLNKCMDRCFLTKEQSLKFVLLLLATSRKYSQFLQANMKSIHFMTSPNDDDNESISQRRLGTIAWLGDAVLKFETSFQHSMKRFLSAIHENVSFNGLADVATLRLSQQLESLIKS